MRVSSMRAYETQRLLGNYTTYVPGATIEHNLNLETSEYLQFSNLNVQINISDGLIVTSGFVSLPSSSYFCFFVFSFLFFILLFCIFWLEKRLTVNAPTNWYDADVTADHMSSTTDGLTIVTILLSNLRESVLGGNGVFPPNTQILITYTTLIAYYRTRDCIQL